MKKIYRKLQLIEEQTNKKILVFEDDFLPYESKKTYKGFGLKQEPFLFGDTFGFTIYRNSLDKKLVYYIYEETKKELEIDFDFHISDAYYETNRFTFSTT